jgi:hypothetical protein
MTLETIGSGEENFTNSFDKLLQEVEKKENPKKPLELLLDEAIKRNNNEKDAKFVKQLTPEQRDIVLIKAQELFQKIWGSSESWKSTDELQITTDEKGLYVRVRRNNQQEWQGPRFIDFSEVQTPKSRVMKSDMELLTESKNSIGESIDNEIDAAFEYNKNLSEDFREKEKKEHNRLYPLSEKVSTKNKETIKKEMIDLWTTYSPKWNFKPEDYNIKITTDYPEKRTLYVRLINNKTNQVIGGGAKLIER